MYRCLVLAIAVALSGLPAQGHAQVKYPQPAGVFPASCHPGASAASGDRVLFLDGAMTFYPGATGALVVRCLLDPSTMPPGFNRVVFVYHDPDGLSDTSEALVGVMREPRSGGPPEFLFLMRSRRVIHRTDFWRQQRSFWLRHSCFDHARYRYWIDLRLRRRPGAVGRPWIKQAWIEWRPDFDDVVWCARVVSSPR